jgi:hypothetical protein
VVVVDVDVVVVDVVVAGGSVVVVAETVIVVLVVSVDGAAREHSAPAKELGVRSVDRIVVANLVATLQEFDAKRGLTLEVNDGESVVL